MRKLLFVFLICFITQQVCSQGNFYIYIQADDNKPFYVRSGSKIFQSSGNGYLVITDLLTDTYDLIIGFPENAGQEWKFTCSIDEKDLGFILKNNYAKGVELNGLKQEKGLTGIKVENKSEKKTTAIKQATGIISEDPFSSMLADVVNDPTIKQQPKVILTARDSLNLLAKALKKDSSVATVAIINKLPENKTSITGDSAKTGINVTAAVLPADKKATYGTGKGKKTDSTLVASTAITDSAKTNTKGVTKAAVPDIVADKKTDGKGNAAAKVDSTAIAAAKPNDSTTNKGVAKTKENKTDSATVAVTKPALIEKKATDKTITANNTEKKTDSVANKPTDTKAFAKNDSSKNSTVLKPEIKKKADSTVVAGVVKPDLTDKKATDKPAVYTEKKVDSVTTKTTTITTPPTDTKAVAKNDVPKSNPSSLGTKKKTDSTTTVIKPTTVTPLVETKKVVVSSTSIKKTMQRKSLDGIELIYVDEMSDGTKETIRILIPVEKN